MSRLNLLSRRGSASTYVLAAIVVALAAVSIWAWIGRSSVPEMAIIGRVNTDPRSGDLQYSFALGGEYEIISMDIVPIDENGRMGDPIYGIEYDDEAFRERLERRREQRKEDPEVELPERRYMSRASIAYRVMGIPPERLNRWLGRAGYKLTAAPQALEPGQRYELQIKAVGRRGSYRFTAIDPAEIDERRANR